MTLRTFNRVCAVPGCGPFVSHSSRAERCPKHAKERHKEMALRRYYREYPYAGGGKTGHHKFSDTQRLNLLIDRSAKFARCPVCRRLMKNCICYQHDYITPPVVKVATWRPDKMKLPR